MATGFKVENGVLSVTPDGKSVRTVMEAAKAKGKRIGLVTTAAIYDATPAAFSMNAKSRRDSQALVDQYLALEPDVLLGGGADYFLPAGVSGGKRKDGKDIVAAFRGKGWQVVTNTAELKAATGAKLIGLFADEDMDFEIDSDRVKEPTMAEMTAGALKALSQANPEWLRAAGRKREHRHRRARQRRCRIDACTVGDRRRGQGGARIPAQLARHAGDRHRRS